MKVYEFFISDLKKHDFKIIKAGWEWDKKNDAVFYLLLGSKPLPKIVEIDGPPLKIKQHVDNFRKMHKRTFVRNRKIFASEQRKFIKPEDLLKNLTKKEFVKERCTSIRHNIL